MAIHPCKECGAPVSDKADSCPQCGAKIKRTSLFVKIILGFIIFTIVMGVIGSFAQEDNNQHKGEAEKPTSNNQGASTPIENLEPKNWTYETSPDELHNKDTKFAITESVNQAYFDFPYNGGSNLMLSIRKNHAGTDAYITISKGQFVCGASSGCDVAFKFDNGEIMNVTMVGPDSYASDVLFVKLDSTEEKIINKIKASKKLIIAPNFYQHGTVQFTFDVSKYKPI